MCCTAIARTILQVVTKYKLAAEITNKTLSMLVPGVVPGASVLELCRSGDALIEKETGAVFNKKNENGEKVEKGIAFPTCISVNEVVCHFSPLPENDRTIEEGDLVKIDLGTHIDGFVATTGKARETCLQLFFCSKTCPLFSVSS